MAIKQLVLDDSILDFDEWIPEEALKELANYVFGRVTSDASVNSKQGKSLDSSHKETQEIDYFEEVKASLDKEIDLKELD